MHVVDTLPPLDHVFGPPTRLLHAPIWAWLKETATTTPLTPSHPLSHLRYHAEAYAESYCAFLKDLIAQGCLKPGETTAIIELGAGDSILSSLLLTTLPRCKAQHGLDHYPTEWVLLDSNPACLPHWHSMPHWQANHVSMDTVMTDVAHLSHARLHRSHQRLTDYLQTRPAMVLAHDLCRHLPCDALHKTPSGDDRLVSVQYSTRPRNLLHAYQPKSLAAVQAQLSTETLPDTLYEAPALNHCASQCLATLPPGHSMLFPVMALRVIQYFQQHAIRGLCMHLQDRPSTRPSFASLRALAEAVTPPGGMADRMLPFGVLKQHACGLHMDAMHCTAPESWHALSCLNPPVGRAIPDTGTTFYPHTMAQISAMHARPIRETLAVAQTTLSQPNQATANASLPSTVTTLIAPMGYDAQLIARVLSAQMAKLPAHRQLAASLLAQLERTIHAYPERTPLWEVAAWAYYQIGHIESARRCFEQLPAGTQTALSQLPLGIACYQQTGQAREAKHLRYILRKKHWQQRQRLVGLQLRRVAYTVKRLGWLMVLVAAVGYFLMQVDRL